MKEPRWNLQVKIRDHHLCKFCGEGQFDHEIVEAHHVKRKSDYPELAEVVDNGETLCIFDHAKEHYKMGDYWGCVLILLRALKIMRKRANWPVITFKQYQALRTVFHEGMNYTEAAKILGCSRNTVSTHIKKLKKCYPDLINDKGQLYFTPLLDKYESFVKQQF